MSQNSQARKVGLSITATILGLFSPLAAAGAATVSFAPISSFNRLAENDPSNGGSWSGLAQSVTAVDERVTFGFHLYGTMPSQVLYSLYAGDGVFTNPLKQVIVNSNPNASRTNFVAADFTNIQLTVGQTYTFKASLLNEQVPTFGEKSDSGALYAATSGNIYTGGRFYFEGASFSQSIVANRDLAFEMVGVTAAIPEPTSWALMIAGFGLTGLGLRRRQAYRQTLA